MACWVKRSSCDSAQIEAGLVMEVLVVLYWLAAAHQPMSGGMAPTIAPTQVLTGWMRLSGV